MRVCHNDKLKSGGLSLTKPEVTAAEWEKAAEFSGPISWTTAMDLGGEHVGTVSGFMNMLGHFGGGVAPSATGFILSATGSNRDAAFYVSASIYAIGAFCWTFINNAKLDLRA